MLCSVFINDKFIHNRDSFHIIQCILSLASNTLLEHTTIALLHCLDFAVVWSNPLTKLVASVANHLHYISFTQVSFKIYLNSTSLSFHSELLIRSGFQGLQLVVTDFLPSLPALCLPVCIAVAGQYGVQNEDLNISLTSIGLLVN